MILFFVKLLSSRNFCLLLVSINYVQVFSPKTISNYLQSGGVPAWICFLVYIWTCQVTIGMVSDLNYKWLKHSPTYLLQFGMFEETLQIVGPQNLEST